MGNYDIRQAVRPLRLVFWGALVMVLDLTFSWSTNGTGFKFDLLDDTVGAIMVAVGVVRLARFGVPGRFADLMSLVRLVAIWSIVETVIDHFIFPPPEWWSLILALLALAELAAVLGFCLAMRWLALDAGLLHSAESWKLTLLLFMCLWVAPLGLLHLAGLWAMATGQALNFNLGAAGLLLIPIMLAPPIHGLVSTARMRREAEFGPYAAPPYTGHGFPVVPGPTSVWTDDEVTEGAERIDGDERG